jgi:hypothetical protein
MNTFTWSGTRRVAGYTEVLGQSKSYSDGKGGLDEMLSLDLARCVTESTTG